MPLISCVTLNDSCVTLNDLLNFSLLCVQVRAKSLQSCPTLCDPTDCSLPVSSVHGILQARILERIAIPSSKGSSGLRDQTQCLLCLLHWQLGSLPLVPHEKPFASPEANK